MATTPPIRALAHAAMAARLDLIADGGYRTKPALVDRAPLAIAQYNKPLQPPVTPPQTQLDLGPVLGVSRSSGSTLRRSQHRPTHGATILAAYLHEHRLTVVGYVKAQEGQVPGDLLEDLWQDHVEMLLDEPTLGQPNLIHKIEPAEGLTTDNGEFEPLGLAAFEQDWIVYARAA